jgi:hypothetical protein
MATTTNFGWDTPDDTDLVKDGAAAIRTALNGVDASFVDLKGGTTGQVLAKNSGTDLDFIWSADAAGMANPMTTTADIIYSSSGSTPARLGIGTAGQVLKVNSGATAPEWATLSSSLASFTQLAVVSLSTGTTTVSGLSGYNTLVAIMGDGSSTALGTTFFCLANGNTGSNYNYFGMNYFSPGSYNTTNLGVESGGTPTRWPFAKMSDNAGSTCSGALIITGANSTNPKIFESVGSASTSGSNSSRAYVLKGFYNESSVISSISFTTNGSGTFDAGDMYVYGSVI